MLLSQKCLRFRAFFSSREVHSQIPHPGITKILCKRNEKCRKMYKIRTNSIKNLFTIFAKYVIIKTRLKYTLYVSIEG